MSTIEAVREKRTPTPASVWQAVAGTTIGDELLEWPPDLFAVTDVILERSEAYRFALSPPAGVAWPPTRIPEWADAVADVSRRWSAWVEGRVGELPDLLVQEWARFRDAAGTPLADFAEARDWGLCVALLTLHAIADEACAGLGVTVDASTATGLLYRARGRELLARTGSLTRIPSHFVRVLPKVRTPPNGTSLRSLSRYACVHRPGVEARWHKVPSRQPHDRGVNYLLLPWPLRVRESDFGPLAGSVQHQGLEPFGFFEFAPSEALDLDLVDRLLVAALDEVDRVDVVVLPESAVDEDEIDGLEALVGSHGVQGLIAGVRGHAEQPGQFPGNWVHLAVSTGEQWARFRQRKHHRWSLDEDQIHQYNLGGALHPRLRWWEAMEVPRRSVQFVDVGEGGTVVALVCEDLAQIDVAEVVRSVGPMIVITPLLDGPQLRSRWAARYASVLADDPGSAVLTLTSFGMAQRCRPRGREPSDVIALWKDPGRGTREIPLEAGAQGVLLSANTGRAARRSFDGRQPVESGSELYNMSVFQVRASPAGSGWADLQAGPPSPALLAVDELTILMSWAEAVADALAFAPERIAAVASAAHGGTPWRALLGIPEPSPQLNHAISVMFDVVRGATAAGDDLALDALILAMRERQPGEARLDRLVHRVLRSALELRQSQRSNQGAPTNRTTADRHWPGSASAPAGPDPTSADRAVARPAWPCSLRTAGR